MAFNGFFKLLIGLHILSLSSAPRDFRIGGKAVEVAPTDKTAPMRNDPHGAAGEF